MSNTEINTVTKICTVCKEEKLITDYHRDKNSKDGHFSHCKKCRSSYVDKDKRSAYFKSWYNANTEHLKSYREANKDKTAARANKRYLLNKDSLAAYNKKWRELNKDSIAAGNKEYVKLHREEYAAHCRNRRARLREATGTHTAEDIQNIFTLQRKKCAVCLTSIAKGYHVDHIVALVNGGSNDKHNLQLLCGHCNCTKSSKDPIEFMNENGRLI